MIENMLIIIILFDFENLILNYQSHLKPLALSKSCFAFFLLSDAAVLLGLIIAALASFGVLVEILLLASEGVSSVIKAS